MDQIRLDRRDIFTGNERNLPVSTATKKTKLNPVVVLTDFMKSKRKSSADLETIKLNVSPAKASYKVGNKKSTSPKQCKGRKRKRKEWDSSVEYEIEKIVGYHRDKHNIMWYLVKWKGWSSDYNTFERMGNLTGCNFELMKFFEYRSPKIEDYRKMNWKVMEALKKQAEYRKLIQNKFSAEDLNPLTKECPCSRGLFEAIDLGKIKHRTMKEYQYILRCLIGMCSHQDPALFLRAQIYKFILLLLQIRGRQLKQLAAIEKSINCSETKEVAIENKIDLAEFPDINYIVELKLGEGVALPYDQPLLGCECPGACGPKSWCCGPMADSLFAYNSLGRLRTSERIAIYECNGRCNCPPTCLNRVVQRGRQVKLCIFKTKMCGWGVKALERIPKGTFVCEYLGELIPDSVAVVRDLKYNQKTTYLFDLDFFFDLKLEMFCIDATTYGNLARFINHSCDPNLVVYPVWVNGLAPNLHRLAFFAKRNIEQNEEIQFDYENLQDRPKKKTNDPDNCGLRMISNVRCQCNAPNCRKWIYGNK